MSQHTPGPWKGQQHGDDYIMKGANGERVFSIRNGVIPMTDDARLIAAAPRMFKLIETSLRAGRFPEVGDGCEVWNPLEEARAILHDVEGK